MKLELLLAEFTLTSGKHVNEQIWFLDERSERMADALGGSTVTYTRHVEGEKYTILFRVPVMAFAYLEANPEHFTNYVMSEANVPMSAIESVKFARG